MTTMDKDPFDDSLFLNVPLTIDTNDNKTLFQNLSYGFFYWFSCHLHRKTVTHQT